MVRKTKGAPKAQTARPVPTPAPKVSQGPQGGLLTLLGLGSVALGLALTVAPNVSWKASQIMVGLDYLGVHGGALVMGGLVLIGLASVLRRIKQVATQLAQAGSDTGLLEHVAADVLQVGTVLEGVERSVGELRVHVDKEVQGLRTAVGQVSAELKQEPEGGLGSEDAIFRLAASLDKVGAKIEERLKTQFADLTDRIGKVEDAVGESAQRIEQAATRAVEPPPAYPAQPLHQTGYHAAPAPSSPGLRPDVGPQGTAIPGQAPAAPMAPAAPLAPAAPTADGQPLPLSETRFRTPVTPPPQGGDPTKSLGLLDHLDDEGVRSPLPAEPHFDQGHSLPVPPQAHGRWDEPVGSDAPSVMSDPQVRAALEDLGQQGH